MNEFAKGMQRRKVWVQEFMQQNKVQQAYQQFWHVVQLQLKTEMEKNGDQLKLFLRTPGDKFNKAAKEANKFNAQLDKVVATVIQPEQKIIAFNKKPSNGSPTNSGAPGVFSLRRQKEIERENREYKERKVKELQDSYEKINSHIKEYDDMAERFEDQVQVYKNYSERDLEKIKNMQPYVKLEQMLEDWKAEQQNQTMSHEQIHMYAAEFWETAKEFEEALKQDYYKFDFEKVYMKQQHDNQLASLRQKAALRIEALEAALNETKIQNDATLERSQMAQAEAESVLLGLLKDENTANNFLIEHEANLQQTITKLDSQKLIDMYSNRIYQQHLVNGKTRRILDEQVEENETLQQQIDFVHEKILSYHTMTKLLVQEFVNAFGQLDLITGYQADNLIKLVRPSQDKMTLDLEEIQSLIKGMQSLQIQKMTAKQIQQRQKQDFTYIQLVRQLIQQNTQLKETSSEWYRKQLQSKPNDLLLNQQTNLSRLIESVDKSIYKKANEILDQEDGTKSMSSLDTRKKKGNNAKSVSPPQAKQSTSGQRRQGFRNDQAFAMLFKAKDQKFKPTNIMQMETTQVDRSKQDMFQKQYDKMANKVINEKDIKYICSQINNSQFAQTMVVQPNVDYDQDKVDHEQMIAQLMKLQNSSNNKLKDRSNSVERKAKKSQQKRKKSHSPRNKKKRDRTKSSSKEKDNKKSSSSPSSSSSTSTQPEPADPFSVPWKLQESLDSQEQRFINDFTLLVNHLNTTFKHVDVPLKRKERREKQKSSTSNLDEMAEKQMICLQDCISFDPKNDVFQLNSIPLKILLLQDKRHLVQKYILETMSLNWQLKNVKVEKNPKVDAEVNVDLYSYNDIREVLQKGLVSIQPLQDIDNEKASVLSSILTSSMSAEFFLLGILSDFKLHYSENSKQLAGATDQLSDALQSSYQRKASITKFEAGRESHQVNITTHNMRKSLAGVGKASRKMSLKLKRKITDDSERMKQQTHLNLPKKTTATKDSKKFKRRATIKKPAGDYETQSKKSEESNQSDEVSEDHEVQTQELNAQSIHEATQQDDNQKEMQQIKFEEYDQREQIKLASTKGITRVQSLDEQSFVSTEKKSDEFERASAKFGHIENCEVNMYDEDKMLYSSLGRRMNETEMSKSAKSRENEAEQNYGDSFNRAVSSKEMNVEEHLRGSKGQNPLQSSIALESEKNLTQVEEVQHEANTTEAAINTILEMRHITMLLQRSQDLQQTEEEINEQKKLNRNKQLQMRKKAVISFKPDFRRTNDQSRSFQNLNQSIENFYASQYSQMLNDSQEQGNQYLTGTRVSQNNRIPEIPQLQVKDIQGPQSRSKMLIKNNRISDPLSRHTISSSALTRVSNKIIQRNESRNMSGIDTHISNWRPSSSFQGKKQRNDKSQTDSQEIFLEWDSHNRVQESIDVSKSTKVLDSKIDSLRKTDLNSSKIEDESPASPIVALLPTRNSEEYQIQNKFMRHNLASVRLSKQQTRQNYTSQANISRNRIKQEAQSATNNSREDMKKSLKQMVNKMHQSMEKFHIKSEKNFFRPRVMTAVQKTMKEPQLQADLQHDLDPKMFKEDAQDLYADTRREITSHKVFINKSRKVKEVSSTKETAFTHNTIRNEYSDKESEVIHYSVKGRINRNQSPLVSYGDQKGKFKVQDDDIQESLKQVPVGAKGLAHFKNQMLKNEGGHKLKRFENLLDQ